MYHVLSVHILRGDSDRASVQEIVFVILSRNPSFIGAVGTDGDFDCDWRERGRDEA